MLTLRIAQQHCYECVAICCDFKETDLKEALWAAEKLHEDDSVISHVGRLAPAVAASRLESHDDRRRGRSVVVARQLLTGASPNGKRPRSDPAAIRPCGRRERQPLDCLPSPRRVCLAWRTVTAHRRVDAPIVVSHGASKGTVHRRRGEPGEELQSFGNRRVGVTLLPPSLLHG